MNMMQASPHVAATGVAVTDRADGLAAFLEPDCAAAIWQRDMPAEAQAWIDDLNPALLPQGRVVVRPEAVRSAIGELCAVARTPDCPERADLIEDIAHLSEIFATLMRAPYLRVRLQAVTSNACRRFHVDAITARLVCTYRGTGTQYGIAANGEDPQHITTIPTGAPILLRGTLWPPKPAAGLLHRSPPIEGTGETRLVLVLDAEFNPEDAF